MRFFGFSSFFRGLQPLVLRGCDLPARLGFPITIPLFFLLLLAVVVVFASCLDTCRHFTLKCPVISTWECQRFYCYFEPPHACNDLAWWGVSGCCCPFGALRLFVGYSLLAAVAVAWIMNSNFKVRFVRHWITNLLCNKLCLYGKYMRAHTRIERHALFRAHFLLHMNKCKYADTHRAAESRVSLIACDCVLWQFVSAFMWLFNCSLRWCRFRQNALKIGAFNFSAAWKIEIALLHFD